MSISDLLTPRPEVVEGRFQGVLQAHKVDAEESRLENDAERLLSLTFPSNALRNVFDRVGDTLEGRDHQGGILLTGPYGSGKSHALLALYHAFDSPSIGQQWADEWSIPVEFPDDARASIVSTSQTDADLIWEPIFRDAGRKDLLEEIKRYPTTDHIEELVADQTTAIFFDEIETWWGSFDQDEDEELLERNEFFLQNVLEVATDPNEDLFVFITLLDKNKDIRRIIDRTGPYAEDLNDTGDRESIILHRLFETPRDELDVDAVRDVVQEYVENYNYPIDIEKPKRYENRMVETYPFHPELLELLDDIYEAARERQNVRGAMNVLADTVREMHDQTNLIITCDVEPRAFRGINRTLFDRYVSDRDTVEDIPFGDDLLRTILLYTLDERRQQASVTECLIGTFKPEKTTVDRLHMSLDGLYGIAHYLDRDAQKEHYFITEDPKLTALVTREQERVLEEGSSAIEETLVEVVREDVWTGDVFVYPDEEIPDNETISVVVTLDNVANGNLTDELNEFFQGRSYQNTVLFVTPKEDIRGDDEILRKAARVLGAENLRGKVEDTEGELPRIIRDERRELKNELEGRYGRWVKWSETPDGDGIRMRRISVSASVNDVKDTVGHDKAYIGETVVEKARETESGITVSSMLNDFKKFRRHPVVLEDEVFDSALAELYRNEKIVIEGDRAKFFAYHRRDPLPDLEDGMTIHHPDNLDESVYMEVEEANGGGEGEPEEEGGVPGHPSSDEVVEPGGDETTGEVVTKQTKRETIRLRGKKARVLLSQAETRIIEKNDTITHIDLHYDVGELEKDDLIEFLKSLPDAQNIDVELEVQRVDED